MGDGDALAIGGNHFIHTARRNIDITAIVFNNNIYGMTGGQYSPTTPVGSITATSFYNSIEKPFDICDLSMSAGASFVARSTVYHVVLLEKLIEKALSKKGFSVVEAMTPCYTTFGRKNQKKSHLDMMKEYEKNAYQVNLKDKLTAEQKKGKYPIGVLKDEDYPEYCDVYDTIINKINGNLVIEKNLDEINKVGENE
jgi:2-oxoglutarate ferredoxin oxidoreductase subunit beta